MLSAAQAGARISHEMAQCSALYDVVWAFSKSDETRHRAQFAARIWIDRAARHAQKETSDEMSVDKLRMMRRADWAARHGTFLGSVEFRDWLHYCRALADEFDVPFDPGPSASS